MHRFRIVTYAMSKSNTEDSRVKNLSGIIGRSYPALMDFLIGYEIQYKFVSPVLEDSIGKNFGLKTEVLCLAALDLEIPDDAQAVLFKMVMGNVYPIKNAWSWANG